MTGRLLITHIAFVGRELPSAVVEFGAKATIVRGPSDTGKSYIVDTIDFMLGGSELREIPQRAAYDHVLMGLTLNDGSDITLSRAVTGGVFTAHQGRITELPSEPAPAGLDAGQVDEAEPTDSIVEAEGTESPTEPSNADVWPRVLSARHDNRSSSNLSRFLLNEIDLDGRQLRRNANNKKSALTIRDVARLCVIDETRMQDATPPGLTGSFTEQTKEASALKFFLQNEDDSALEEVQSPKDRKKLGEAQTQVLDRLLDNLRPRVEEAAPATELQAQSARLSAAIASTTGSIETAGHARARTARLLAESQRDLREGRERLAEARALDARFDLLRAQYESDLQRLEMVSEAGSLMGLFDQGTCAFCGAQPEHQKLHMETTSDTTDLGSIVAAETSKTAVLLEDLASTRDDLAAQIRSEFVRNAQLSELVQTRTTALALAEANLAPLDGDLNQLIAERSRLDELLSLYSRIDDLEAMQQQIVRDAKSEKAVAVQALSLVAVNDFSTQLQARLAAWGYPDAENVRFDRNELDIVDGDQMRSAHGKGVKAVLHAAFTVALADHCFAQGIPHPGFVVIDSPLVTYRPPKPGETADEQDETDRDALGAGFTDRFYDDLERHFGGQIVIVENTDPPLPVSPGTTDIEFTKSDAGRYGLFPTQ